MKYSLKYSAVVLCVLLCLPAVLAADVETVISQGSAYDLEEAVAYVYYPDPVGVDQFFSVDVVLVGALGSYSIVLDGAKNQEPQFSAGDTIDDESYVQASWRERLSASASYSLAIVDDNTTVLEESFSITPTITGEIIDQVTEVAPFIPPSDDALATIRSLLAQQGQEYSLNAYANAMKTGEEIPALRQTTIITTDYNGTTQQHTRTTISLNPEIAYGNISIIESIPKEVAATTDDIVFAREPIILERDPIVMWHLENVDGSQTVSYEVEGEVQVTGNTVILASEQEELKKQLSWKIIGPIVVIPLIAVLIIFFAQFTPKERKRKEK